MAKRKRGRVSQQVAWQRARVKEGNCRRCGRQRGAYAVHCDYCQALSRAAERVRCGYEPRRKGGVGRPIVAPVRLRKRAA